MDSLQSKVRRGAAFTGVVVAPLAVLALALNPSILGADSGSEPPAVPSLDFTNSVIDDTWVTEGTTMIVDEAGGALLLDGRDGQASVTHALDGEIAVEIAYVDTHSTDDALAPTASVGIFLSDDAGSELLFAIGADSDGVTGATVSIDGTVLAATPIGAPTAPRLRVTQTGDFYSFQVAPPGQEFSIVAALSHPFDATEVSYFADSTAAVLDFAMDIREPFVVEDGPIPDFVVVDVSANAGPDVRVTDPDGDAIEALTFSAQRSTGDVVEWRWWFDGTPISRDPSVTFDVAIGTHTVLLEIVSSTGARDADEISVTVAASDGAGSDDFSRDGEAPDMDPAWVSDGEVRLIADSGGSVLLEGAAEYSAIERPNSGDLAIEAAFVAVAPVEGLHTGIVFSNAEGDQLRFSLEVGGDDVVLASVTELSANPRVLSAVPIGASSSPSIRVIRRGDFWQFTVAPSPETELTRAAFTSDFEPVSGGVFAEGGPTIIDFIEDERDPLVSEDGVDVPSPRSFIAANVGRDVVVFDSDGDLAEVLEFSGEGTVGDVAAWRWLLDGELLEPGPTATAEVGIGVHVISLEVISPTGEREVDTAEVLVVDPTTGPLIRSWYGDSYRVDRVQHPQRWINLLGEIIAPRPLADITYSVDGGSPVDLSIGPNSNRLVQDGDFNIELALDDISDGDHQVRIVATDVAGDRSEHTLSVDVFTGNEGATAPEELLWSTVDDISQLTEIAPIDGRWTITEDGIEVDPSYTGYDRLIGVGSRSLVDYEVRADFTIKSYHAPTSASSDRPAVGLLLRWQGHNDSVEPGTRPRAGFLPDSDSNDPIPAGAFAFWRLSSTDREAGRAVFRDSSYSTRSSDSQLDVAVGVPHTVWASVQTAEDGSTTYRFKIWRQGESEPSGGLTFVTSADDPQPLAGSIVLIAHNSSVVWSNIAVTPTGR